jgi:hypothetical protein
VAGERPQPVDGAAAGAWIPPALDGDWGGRVKNLIPQIFEAYARIFHPAHDRAGAEVTWAEVARRLGTTAHREMQWHAIVSSYDPSSFRDSCWAGETPETGELSDEKMDALCALLAGHTGTPESAFFGVSTIYGGVGDEWPDAPQHKQRAREWVILHGPLTAVGEIALSTRHGFSFVFYAKGHEPPPDYEQPEEFLRQAPNLIWPEDRAWFVATEYDFDSTLVGGSRALIDALLAAPELEVWEVDGEVSLTEDADKRNPVPDPPPGWGEPQDPKVLMRNSFEEMFEEMDGSIATAAVDDGVLALEVDDDVTGWRVEAYSSRSSWPADRVEGLPGAAVEKVEVDPETDALRLRLGGGSVFEMTPTPRGPDDGAPSWRVHTPFGMRLKHGPELLFEFPDE